MGSNENDCFVKMKCHKMEPKHDCTRTKKGRYREEPVKDTGIKKDNAQDVLHTMSPKQPGFMMMI